MPVCNKDAVCTEDGLKTEGVQRLELEEQDMGDGDDITHLVVAGLEASGCVVDGT